MPNISGERRVCVVQSRRRVALPGSMSLSADDRRIAPPSAEINRIIPQMTFAVGKVFLMRLAKLVLLEELVILLRKVNQ